MEKTVMFRTFEESDVAAIYKWLNDDDLTSMSVGLSRRLSYEEAENWVKARKNHNPYKVFWAICPIGQPEKIIGYACLTDIHYVNSSANFDGIVIGDPDYRNGVAWVETYLFILEYAFDRLNLNRLFNTCIVEHPVSNTISEVLFYKKEGEMREAVYKNGCFYDLAIWGILKREYNVHKQNGEYEFNQVIRRFSRANRNKKNG